MTDPVRYYGYTIRLSTVHAGQYIVHHPDYGFEHDGHHHKLWPSIASAKRDIASAKRDR